MSAMTAWCKSILESVKQSLLDFSSQLTGWAPKLIGAVIILIVGWILAVFFSKVIVKLFKLLKFDYFAEKFRIDAFFAEGGIKMKAIQVIDRLIYWLLMLCVVLAACSWMGWDVASVLLTNMAEFIPHVVVAVVVLLVGAFVARVTQTALLAYLKNIGILNAEGISKVGQYLILILTAWIAFGELKIGGEVIPNAFLVAFSGISLAFGLAFGLGGKEWASGVIHKLSQKK